MARALKLLRVGNDRLVIYHQLDGSWQSLAGVDDRIAEGQTPAAFARWLSAQPIRQRWRLLLDLDDESHFVETLPLLRGKDQRALLERRLRHWLDDPSHACARPFGPRREGRQRVLFCGLNRPQRLRPLLTLLSRQAAAIEVMLPLSSLIAHCSAHYLVHCSAHLLASPAANDAPAPPGRGRWRRQQLSGSPPALILSGSATQQLRLTLCVNGLPRLSRLLVREDDEGGEGGEDRLASEIVRTCNYARDLLGDSDRAALLQLRLLVPASHQAGWQTLLARTELSWQPCSLPPSPAPDEQSATDDLDPRLLHALATLSRASLAALGWPLGEAIQQDQALPRKPLYALATSLALGGSLALREELPLPVAAPPAATVAAQAVTPAVTAQPQPAATDADSNTSPTPAAAPPVARQLSGLLRNDRGQQLLWLDGELQPLPAELRLLPWPAAELQLVASGGETRLRAGDRWSNGSSVRSLPPATAEDDEEGRP